MRPADLFTLTLAVDLDGNGFVATCHDPQVASNGRTVSIAVYKLMMAIRQAYREELDLIEAAMPSAQVIQFPGKRRT